MDNAMQTMIDNLAKNTGKTLEQWISIVSKSGLEKHGAIVKFLKEEHGMTHGFANMVAHKTKGSDAGSVENKDALVTKQYTGKEQFVPIYDKLIKAVSSFGKDVEIAPKNTYVSLRRKKQFAILNPATKTRYEVGINLKGTAPEGKLEAINTAAAMCSHKINISSVNDVDKEVIKWLKVAYENAG